MQANKTGGHFLKKWINHPAAFWVILGLYVVAFLFTRLPFFTYYGIPEAGRDTFNYYDTVYTLLQGKAPLLDEKTIGFPFFLYLIELTGSSPIKVLLTQSVIFLLSCVFYTRTALKHLGQLGPAAAAGMFVFYLSPFSLRADTGLIPTSLFTSAVIVLLATFIIAVYSLSFRNIITYSVLAGITILIRPQGFFIIPITLLFAGHLLLIHKKKAHALVSVIPLFSMLLLNSTYNYFTYHKFTFTDFTAMNNLGSSIYMLETSTAYPDYVNDVIAEENSHIPEEKKQIIFHSTKYSELKNVFNFWDDAWIFRRLTQHYPPETARQNLNDQINQIATDAKQKHPDIYLKFILTNLVLYYDNFTKPYFFYYNELTNRCHYWSTDEYTKGDDAIIRLTWKNMLPYPKGNKQFTFCNKMATDGFAVYFAKEPVLLKANHYWNLVYNKLFSNLLLLFGFFAGACYSLYLLVKTKAGNTSVVLSAMSLLVLFNTALVILVQSPLQRFSHPVSFVYFTLSFYLLQLLVLYFIKRTKQA